MAKLQSLKNSVESQLGIRANADTPARQCGAVGGNMVKQLIASSGANFGTLKNEISAELGIQVGPDTPAKFNGAVGGHMVKRAIQQAEGKYTR